MVFKKNMLTILAHVNRRLIGELIVYQSSRRLSVCLSVSLSTFSNKNISTTSKPNSTKLYLKHPLGGGLTAIGFGPGRIRTLVSMATDNSHKGYNGGNLVTTLAPTF